MTSKPTCPHHRICGSPFWDPKKEILLVSCTCKLCGDVQTVPADGTIKGQPADNLTKYVVGRSDHLNLSVSKIDTIDP